MKYEKIKYPDGQISVKLDREGKGPLKIRINSYEDLITLLAIAEAADKVGIYNIDVEIPCLFGQRSDRRFAANQSFDLKIIAQLINSCKFNSVSIFDPHSDISLALIDHSRKDEPHEYVKEALYDIDRTWKHPGENYMVLVSPDAGAYKKVFSMGEEFKLPVVAAVKHRDLDGKIDLKFIGDVKDKECLIVDDLCDGGRTFEILSKALREQGAKKVYLYVSHGYFSKGFDELKKTINHIYCTNSVKDVEDPFVTQFKII